MAIRVGLKLFLTDRRTGRKAFSLNTINIRKNYEMISIEEICKLVQLDYLIQMIEQGVEANPTMGEVPDRSRFTVETARMSRENKGF